MRWLVMTGTAALALSAVAVVRIESVERRSLPKLNGMSGICPVGGDDYLLLQDHADGEQASKFRPLKLRFDPATGRIVELCAGDAVALAESPDTEDLVFDAASGTLWAVDERGPRLREFRRDGSLTGRSAPVPEMFSEGRGWVFNRSLEALAISEDGLMLWTANEQALKDDGALTDTEPGVAPLVRIVRFVRPSPADDWRVDRAIAYRVDPSAGSLDVQNGIAGLCALPDGSLLVLEREVSTVTSGRCRIYRLSGAAARAATDVSAVSSLKTAEFAAVEKGRPLVDFDHRRNSSLLNYRMTLYEGLCLGPRLADGSRVLVMVADGGEKRTKTLGFVTAGARTVSELGVWRIVGLP